MFEGKKDLSKADIKKHSSNKDELYDCLKHCAEHHTSYKIYYSDYEIVKSILREKYLILRNDYYNDRIDEYNIQNDSDGFKKFVLCFTISISENVAMWIVYSKKNVDNNYIRGAMIPFSSEMLKDIVKNNEIIEFGHFDMNSFESIGKTKDFQIEICDIIYYSKNKDSNDIYDIKRADDTAKCSKEIIDDLSYIKKYYPWNYENECRLIVKIKKEIVNQRVNSIRLALPDNVIKKMKEKCVSSPLCENDGELKDSSLMGQLRF